MTRIGSPEVIVIGGGPNGLSAAIAVAREGLEVVLLEGEDTVGGGLRSAGLTRPGFVHDVCASVLPLGAGSPFLRTLPLERHGLEWVHPEVPLAHPFDSGRPALLHRSVERTAEGLGGDGEAYRDLAAPLVRGWDGLAEALLGPLRIPRRPLALARFGLPGLRPAAHLARARFTGGRARGLFAGLAAHGVLPLERAGTSAFALVLGAAGHAVGWPFVRGGTGRLADALAAHLRHLGGRILTGVRVRSVDELPRARAVLCDVGPRELLRLAGHRLPARYRRSLERYRYGPGVHKVDWALDGPIPWRDPACGRAGTLHLGGTLDEIAAAEGAVWRGRVPERPFVLLAQASLFDPERAPEGRHTAWAYCHVPHASSTDVTDRIEAQVERFAPGFRDRILARSAWGPTELEAHNPNLVGGDIGGGSNELRQLLLRPTRRLHRTPLPWLYLCSASTPPGGGVHGMCGYRGARAALSGLRDPNS